MNISGHKLNVNQMEKQHDDTDPGRQWQRKIRLCGIYINKDKLSRPVVQCGGEYVNLADQPDLEIVRLL